MNIAKASERDIEMAGRLESNPLVWMLSVNGMIVDIRDMPREAQEIAFEKGYIPYILAGI